MVDDVDMTTIPKAPSYLPPGVCPPKGVPGVVKVPIPNPHHQSSTFATLRGTARETSSVH